jgi:acetyl-CoA carboxylase carboxyltransferase component
MEGESAVQALYSRELESIKRAGGAIGEELQQAMEQTRADYERSLDAKWGAARGYTDAVIDPRQTRSVLDLCLRAAATSKPLIA